MSAPVEPQQQRRDDATDAEPSDANVVEVSKGGECPICVMFAEGGCKEAFDAFMDCGVQAEKGKTEYQDCVKLFDAMRECMQRNPAVFGPLLQDVNHAVDSPSKEEAQPKKEAQGAA